MTCRATCIAKYQLPLLLLLAFPPAPVLHVLLEQCGSCASTIILNCSQTDNDIDYRKPGNFHFNEHSSTLYIVHVQAHKHVSKFTTEKLYTCKAPIMTMCICTYTQTSINQLLLNFPSECKLKELAHLRLQLAPLLINNSATST